MAHRTWPVMIKKLWPLRVVMSICCYLDHLDHISRSATVILTCNGSQAPIWQFQIHYTAVVVTLILDR